MGLTVTRIGLIVWLMGLVLIQVFYVKDARYYGLDAWLSRDAQGKVLFDLGHYKTAAQRFESVPAKALSHYAAEEFEQAGKYFQQRYETVYGAQAYFNWANAMAHQTQYLLAIEGFEKALAIKPNWPEATHNLTLMRVLNQKALAVDDFDGASQGEIGADDYVFDLAGKREAQATDDEAVLANQDALQTLWLKRLNTQPTDFLARKFAYQVQASSAVASP